MPSSATSPEVSLALPADPTTSASAEAQNFSTLNHHWRPIHAKSQEDIQRSCICFDVGCCCGRESTDLLRKCPWPRDGQAGSYLIAGDGDVDQRSNSHQTVGRNQRWRRVCVYRSRSGDVFADRGSKRI